MEHTKKKIKERREVARVLFMFGTLARMEKEKVGVYSACGDSCAARKTPSALKRTVSGLSTIASMRHASINCALPSHDGRFQMPWAGGTARFTGLRFGRFTVSPLCAGQFHARSARQRQKTREHE